MQHNESKQFDLSVIVLLLISHYYLPLVIVKNVCKVIHVGRNDSCNCLYCSEVGEIKISRLAQKIINIYNDFILNNNNNNNNNNDNNNQ